MYRNYGRSDGTDIVVKNKKTHAPAPCDIEQTQIKIEPDSGPVYIQETTSNLDRLFSKNIAAIDLGVCNAKYSNWGFHTTIKRKT